jgi:hypothetical protein
MNIAASVWMIQFRSDFTEAVAFQFRWAHPANVNLVETMSAS